MLVGDIEPSSSRNVVQRREDAYGGEAAVLIDEPYHQKLSSDERLNQGSFYTLVYFLAKAFKNQ
ncbi:hypothetical protein [Halomonas sp. WWR20]